MTRTTPTSRRPTPSHTPSRQVNLVPRAIPEGRAATPEFRTFARNELGRERQKRGKLVFLDRMETDVVHRRALNQVCTWRQDPENRRALDQAVDEHRPKSAPD